MVFKILLDNGEIKQVNEIVFLGVILDEHLTWKSHINYVSNKISKSIGIIRKSSYFLLKQSLFITQWCIHTYIIVISYIWASTYPSNLFRLMLLQKRMARILNNSTFDSHTSEIFKNLRLFKFHDICKLQTAQFMFLRKQFSRFSPLKESTS